MYIYDNIALNFQDENCFRQKLLRKKKHIFNFNTFLPEILPFMTECEGERGHKIHCCVSTAILVTRKSHIATLYVHCRSCCGFRSSLDIKPS